MICDDCIYSIGKENFKCSIYDHIKVPRKMQCMCHTDTEHEMPGDMFWNQPIEDFYDYTDEKLKKAFPNKWEVVKERIEKIKQSCGNM